NYVHIGNARGPVVFGVLADLLRRRYGALRYARNITDVADKINAAAREQGVPSSAITDRFAAAYREDLATPGVVPPDIEPEALAPRPGRNAGRRPRRRGSVQARSGRFRAVEAVHRRPARLGVAVGPWPPGLAHRMLGDGRRASGPDHRYPCRRRGPAVPAPRE